MKLPHALKERPPRCRFTLCQLVTSNESHQNSSLNGAEAPGPGSPPHPAEPTPATAGPAAVPAGGASGTEVTRHSLAAGRGRRGRRRGRSLRPAAARAPQSAGGGAAQPRSWLPTRAATAEASPLAGRRLLFASNFQAPPTPNPPPPCPSGLAF